MKSWSMRKVMPALMATTGETVFGGSQDVSPKITAPTTFPPSRLIPAMIGTYKRQYRTVSSARNRQSSAVDRCRYNRLGKANSRNDWAPVPPLHLVSTKMIQAMIRLESRYGQARPCEKSMKISGTLAMAEAKRSHEENEASEYSAARSRIH